MLYSFGSNGSGQLGIGHEGDVAEPSAAWFPSTDDLNGQVPVKISAGGNHTLILTRSGSIYSAGENGDGRCCFIDSDRKTSSTFLPAGHSEGAEHGLYKLCSTTWETSVLVSDSDTVFTCGTGNRGELGQGHGITRSLDARAIHGFPTENLEIVDIASCVSHTVAILSNGHAYGWGAGRKGQLGLPAVDCWTPRRIDGLPFKAHRVACGREFTFIVGPSSNGRFVILGSDKWSVRSAAPLKVSSWKDVGASWGSIFVLFNSGDLLGWGRNDHDQLPPQQCQDIEFIAVGSEHVIAKNGSGSLLARGWGEHGNCGRPLAANETESNDWSVIPTPGHITVLGAGCATSWIHIAEQ